MRSALGARHGWKRQAADLLGIDPSVISRALAPRSDWKLTHGIAEQVSRVAGIPLSWFESGDGPWYAAASWGPWKRPHPDFVLAIAGLERAAQAAFTHHARGTLAHEHGAELVRAWATHPGLKPVGILLLGFGAFEQPSGRLREPNVGDPTFTARLAETTLDFVQAAREAFDGSQQRQADARAGFVEAMSAWARADKT